MPPQIYNYPYPMAAPGAGVIFYHPGPQPNSLWVGAGLRSANVGAGYGISAGGFAELAPLLTAPLGTTLNLLDEAWRETTEEIPGIETILTHAIFTQVAHYLTSLAVHTPDSNHIHVGVYFGIPITPQQAQAISTLPAGDETQAPLNFYLLTWPVGTPEEAELNIPSPLYHTHEIHAFRALASHHAGTF